MCPGRGRNQVHAQLDRPDVVDVADDAERLVRAGSSRDAAPQSGTPSEPEREGRQQCAARPATPLKVPNRPGSSVLCGRQRPSRAAGSRRRCDSRGGRRPRATSSSGSEVTGTVVTASCNAGSKGWFSASRASMPRPWSRLRNCPRTRRRPRRSASTDAVVARRPARGRDCRTSSSSPSMARLLRSTSFTTSRRDRTRASSYSAEAAFNCCSVLLHLPVALGQPLFELLDIGGPGGRRFGFAAGAFATRPPPPIRRL